MLHWWSKSFSTYDTNCPSASFYIQIAWSTADSRDVGHNQGECWSLSCVPLWLVGFGLGSSGSSCWKDQVSSNRISVIQCDKVVSLCLLQDFAVSGIRFGTLYTENQDVVNAVASLCYFHGVCGPVQHKVAQLLRDRGESVAPCAILCHSVYLGTWKISPSLTFHRGLLFVQLNWQSSVTLKLPMQHEADSSAEKDHFCWGPDQ